MPARKGHCTNFGLCGKADQRKRLKIPEGKPSICPECAQSLDTREPLGGFPWRLVSSLAAIFLLSVAMEVYQVGVNLDAHDQTHPAIMAERVLQQVGDASRVGSALASSLAEAVLELWSGPAGQPVPTDQEAAAPVRETLPEKSAPKDGKR